MRGVWAERDVVVVAGSVENLGDDYVAYFGDVLFVGERGSVTELGVAGRGEGGH